MVHVVFVRPQNFLASRSQTMNVEVKVSLETVADYVAARQLFTGAQRKTRQHALFFDGTHNQISGAGAFLRLRVTEDLPPAPSHSGDTATSLAAPARRATLCLKEHNDIDAGSCVRFVQECAVPLDVAFHAERDPVTLLTFIHRSPLGAAIENLLGSNGQLRYVGALRTDRIEVVWSSCVSQPGLALRLDSTQYGTTGLRSFPAPSAAASASAAAAIDTQYEIETGRLSVPAEDVRRELCHILQASHIRWHLSEGSKFDTLLRVLQARCSNYTVEPALTCDLKFALASASDFEIVRFNLEGSELGPPVVQVDYFWDGPSGELSRHGAVLRLRVLGDHGILSLKEFTAAKPDAASVVQEGASGEAATSRAPSTRTTYGEESPEAAAPPTQPDRRVDDDAPCDDGAAGGEDACGETRDRLFCDAAGGPTGAEGSSMFWSHEERLPMNVVSQLLASSDASASRWLLTPTPHHVTPTPPTIGSGAASSFGGAKSIAELLRRRGVSALKKVSGFRTTRQAFRWKVVDDIQSGLTVRLDATEYPFGTRYELEVPGITVPLQDVVEEVCSALTNYGATYRLNASSKFEQLMEGHSHWK